MTSYLTPWCLYFIKSDGVASDRLHLYFTKSDVMAFDQPCLYFVESDDVASDSVASLLCGAY